MSLKNNNLSVDYRGINIKNPIVIASGPAGNGEELSQTIDLSRIGMFTSKTVTMKQTDGNPPPRIVDVYGGIINSIGLQNPGFKSFMKETLPFLENLEVPVIVSLASNYTEELETMLKELDTRNIKFLEINFSCPNVDKGREPIGTNPNKIFYTVKKLRKLTKKTILIKFAPVDAILELVQAAISAGAEGVVLSNCPKGMKIDINTMKPILKREFGGFAGPAIKPITLNQVYQVRKQFKDIMIIGTGGVINHEDALEYIMAGANLVGVGFGVMLDPFIPIQIVEQLEQWFKLRNLNYSSVFCKAQSL
ncbi:MAG: dihydroorotate dehydrogenase [Thermotogota bacterium]|nr:dihydroorotate dehydrogenase [Thermotogota bacterium]